MRNDPWAPLRAARLPWATVQQVKMGVVWKHEPFVDVGIQHGWLIMENPIQMDDDWGYPYFRKPPDNVPLETVVYPCRFAGGYYALREPEDWDGPRSHDQ